MTMKKLTFMIDVRFQTGLVEYWQECKGGGSEIKNLPKAKVAGFLKKLDPALFSFDVTGGGGSCASIPRADMIPGSVFEVSSLGDGGLEVVIKGEGVYEFLPRQADPFLAQKKALCLRVRSFSYFTGGIVDELNMSSITAWVKGFRENPSERDAIALLPLASKWKIK